MKYLLIPLYKDTILHKAHSITLQAPPSSELEERLEAALEAGTLIEFDNIMYFVDEEIGVENESN